MKRLLLAFLVTTGVAQSVSAGDLPTKVTNEFLASWQTSGIDSIAQNNSPALTLPAGARITRTFLGGTVILHIISQPQFVQKNTDWPIVVLGPVTLVFQQENGEGHIVLADAGGAIKTVSGSYPIDAAGKSARPLDLALAYDSNSGTVVVAVDQQLQSFQQTSGLSSIEVLLSAGADTPWALDNLEVELLSAENTGDGVRPNNAPLVDGAKGGAVSKSTGIVREFFAGQIRKTAPQGSVLDVPASVPPTPKRRTKLEVITPPSARNLSPEALRALVQKAQAN